MSALEEIFGAPSPGLAATLSHPMGEGAVLGRETKGEVVLVSRLRAALERLNPALPPEAITAAVDELTRDRSAMSLEAANREVYLLLKEGIRVSVAERILAPALSQRRRTSIRHLRPALSPVGGEGAKGDGQRRPGAGN